MPSGKPNGLVTPLMFEVLQRLVEEPDAKSRCGRTTRQRLVREGLAIYREDSVVGPGWTEWDREMQVTDAGRRLVANPPLFVRLRMAKRKVRRG